MRKLRWGVISTAYIGVVKVIPGMQQGELSEIVAIASRDLTRAQAAASKLGIPKAYGSYHELIADPEIEAIYNPLPNHLHAEWTLAAARAGKHVLCEKPLALNWSEARMIADGCRKAGVKLMEAFMYRLHPQWVRVREIVQSGRIGQLMAIQAFFSYRNLDPANIRNVREYGGGALLDIGCYCINLSRMLFQAEPDRVVGTILNDPNWGVDILTSGILDFAGRQGAFTCGTQLEPEQRVHIIGTEGRLLVEIPFNIPWDRPTRLILTAGGNHPTDPHNEVITIPARNQYTVQGDLFSEAVLQRKPAPIPIEDAIANMKVIDRMFECQPPRG